MAHNVITDALVAPRIRFHLFRRKLMSNDARCSTEAEREGVYVLLMFLGRRRKGRKALRYLEAAMTVEEGE